VSSTKLKNELKKIHPYELPEIVEIKMDSVDKNYLKWLIG
jgi:periplasmic divalent cation tolerance protein